MAKETHKVIGLQCYPPPFQSLSPKSRSPGVSACRIPEPQHFLLFPRNLKKRRVYQHFLCVPPWSAWHRVLFEHSHLIFIRASVAPGKSRLTEWVPTLALLLFRAVDISLNCPQVQPYTSPPGICPQDRVQPHCPVHQNENQHKTLLGEEV